MSTAQFTIPLITVVPGQLITAALWNNEYNNLNTNLNPLGIGAYSDTDPQMQTSTDPFPGGTSRPTSIGGELERLRYILNLIIGKTYWYQHPSINLETLNTSTPVIPSGTVMLFYQAAAPTGWTQVTTQDNKALRVVSGSGGGAGGSQGLNATINLAHAHTVASHNHTISHEHTVPIGSNMGGSNSNQFIPNTPNDWGATDDQSINVVDIARGSTIGIRSVTLMKTRSMDTANSGSASPSTDSQLSNINLAYIDVILCSKN